MMKANEIQVGFFRFQAVATYKQLASKVIHKRAGRHHTLLVDIFIKLYRYTVYFCLRKLFACFHNLSVVQFLDLS